MEYEYTYCTVCKGSGITELPNVPSTYGGYLSDHYITSGIECGACHGSGQIRRHQGQPLPSTTISNHPKKVKSHYDDDLGPFGLDYESWSRIDPYSTGKGISGIDWNNILNPVQSSAEKKDQSSSNSSLSIQTRSQTSRHRDRGDLLSQAIEKKGPCTLDYDKWSDYHHQLKSTK